MKLINYISLVCAFILSFFLLESCTPLASTSAPKKTELESKLDQIQIGWSVDAVRDLIGNPHNRQMDEIEEIWQYCESNISHHKFYVVTFKRAVVSGISNYSKNRRGSLCNKCQDCFKEIKKSYSSSRRQTTRKPAAETVEALTVNIDELVQQLESKEPIILAHFNPGTSIPSFVYSAKTLQELMDHLNASSQEHFILIGHTNSSGAEAANMTLSISRSEMTKEMLVYQYKLKESKLVTKGLGETAPKFDNDTKEGRSKNSRVELLIYEN